MGCLTGKVFVIGEELYGKAVTGDKQLIGNVLCVSKEITGSCHIICSVNKSSYLNVIPNIVWLSPDELASANFDIISNVSWTIDVPEIEEPEVAVLEYLQNGTLLMNDTLLKNEDVTTISIMNNGTLVSNDYYFTNY